jgi:hypothetical protein
MTKQQLLAGLLLAAAASVAAAIPAAAAPPAQGMTEGFAPGAVVIPVRFPTSGGPGLFVCGAPYVADGSGEASLLVRAAPDGGWHVVGRLQPESLTLRHPSGTALRAIGQDAGQIILAPGQPEGTLRLVARFLGPAGAPGPALTVTFALRVTVGAEGTADATVIGATCD